MKQFSPDHIIETDKLTRSPHRRMIKVWMYLKKNEDISHWDIMCFCAAYVLNTITIYPFLRTAAAILARDIKAYHYTYPETLDSKKDGIQLESESTNKAGESAPTTLG